MTIKKILLLVSLFVFTTSVAFAITKDGLSEKKESVGSVEKALKTAKNYYCEGEFEKAEKCIDQILIQHADNEKANELKNKIMLLKEKKVYYTKNIVKDYRIEIRRTVKEGNYYEGFLFIKKVNELAPEENMKSLYNRLLNEKEMVLYALDNSKDRKTFLESVDLFVDEKYTKATKLIYKLYKKYPKFVDYVGMCRYYSIHENNEKRIENLYKKAVKCFKETRLGEARDYATICYSLEPTDIKLKILIDQINMEII